MLTRRRVLLPNVPESVKPTPKCVYVNLDWGWRSRGGRGCYFVAGVGGSDLPELELWIKLRLILIEDEY
ncbi:Uricase [Fusarium oxysporum f. sp. albedinis]|nr:Uricase [Fusarium oxysporum f. sp. albedinis]